MKAINFGKDWTCRHLTDPGSGTPVTIPHDAMLSEPRSALSAGGVNTGWFEGHDYLYEKRFMLEPQADGQRLVLEFEGVYRHAEVSLNGEKLCFRPYGYTNFDVDITDRVVAGAENLLQVVARNADQPNSRWYSGAGIYRPVTLWTAPAQHIQMNGLRVRTVSIDPPAVEVTVLTQGEGEVSVEIFEADAGAPARAEDVRGAAAEQAQPRDGAVVLSDRAHSDGKAVFTLTIPDGKLWSVENPHLYTCKATFGGDSSETTFGVRELSWGRDGLLLNGERVILRGACVHHDNGVLGACCYEDAERRKVRLLKESGYNAIRSAHNPCSKALLDACDRQGVLVMDEYIDQWYIHKTEYDYAAHFDAWWRQDLTDMVDKDYNHPCVIMYSTGNEVSETAQPRGIALTRELTEFLHGLDPTRPVTCGVNIFFNFLASAGFGVYSDEKAKKEAAKAEKAKDSGAAFAKKKAVGSEFFNNLAGLLGDEFMKRGATLPPCDWRTRDAFAAMDIAGYNYGVYRYRRDLKKYPGRLILGSETFCKDAYRFYELAKSEPRLVGDFVWAGIDYLGEVGLGAWEYADYAPDFGHGVGWVAAGSGRLDLTGRALGEALYTRVAFELEKGPRIAVCPVNHTGEKHSPSAWRMSNAIPSWSWNGCAGKEADVEVYARCARVELLVNGKSAGVKKMKDDCIARFKCAYEDGAVEAVAYDAAGKETGRCTLHTAGSRTQLRAAAEEASVRPGGLCFIRLQYTDEDGIVKPLERGELRVQVEGGKLLGLGSACPYNETGYLTDCTDTYFGEALAVVQAGRSGAVCLTVTDGRHTGKATVEIR